MALLDKVPHGKGVLEDIARREALVRLHTGLAAILAETFPVSHVSGRRTHHVKEGKVLLFLADVRELLPLRLGGVDTGRVLVGLSAEHDRTVRGEGSLRVRRREAR